MTLNLSRRSLLQNGASLGVAAPLIASLGSVANAAVGPDYKALVCVFLQGGNDAHNTLLATDQDSWGRYWKSRATGSAPIAVMPPGTPRVSVGQTSAVSGRVVGDTTYPEYWGGALPITPKTAQPIPVGTAPPASGTRTFAVHPLLPNVQRMFQSGRMAALSNVGNLVGPLTKAQYAAAGKNGPGVPPRLFSHDDQQIAWQSGHISGSSIGWGGLLADTFVTYNTLGVDFSSFSTTSSTVFPQGERVKSYRIKMNKGSASAVKIDVIGWRGIVNSSAVFVSELQNTIRASTLANDLALDVVDVVNHSIDTASAFNAGVTGTVVNVPTPYVNPLTGLTEVNELADQLQTVAQTIASSASFGGHRQIFFVQLTGFDTHNQQNHVHAHLLSKLDHALAYFDATLQGLNLSNAVTTFTASDFGRTFTTNGDGTDHAWGGHHFIMGGAVKGGDIYGQHPTLGVDVTGGFSNPDMSGNSLIPTTSVEQYLATMGRWFGVDQAHLDYIFPRLKSFGVSDLGFMGV